MNVAVKIRWLLALVAVSLFLTAIIARVTYSPANNLARSARELENNLNQKEQRIHSFTDDRETFDKLKSIGNNPAYALRLIDGLARNEKIYLTTFDNNQLTYWNGIRVIHDNVQLLKNGSSFFKSGNGYYEAIKITDGNFSAIFYIPIKNSYSYQNTYLQNVFSPYLLNDDNIDIANIADRNVYSIHTYEHQYLFSVKLKANVLNHSFIYLQVLLWLTGMLLLCMLANNLAAYMARKGYTAASFLILAAFILLIWFIILYFHWPNIYSGISLFDPGYYHRDGINTSLGDLVINTLLVTWFSFFVYNQRNQLIRPVKSKINSYLICAACVLFLIALSFVLLDVFSTLIKNSNINFDVHNVLNLTGLSVVGVGIISFGFLIFIIWAEICLAINSKLNIPHTQKLYILLSLVLLATGIGATQKDYSCSYLLWSMLVIIRGYAVFYDRARYSPLMYIAVIIVCSSVASVKLFVFQSEKEKQTRIKLIRELEATEDINDLGSFKQVEDQIIKDSFLISYFSKQQRNYNYLKSRFQKLYFEGSLSKFDVETYEYDKHDKLFSGNTDLDLSDFKSMVIYRANKVDRTNYFYKYTDSIGSLSYFAIIPVNTGSAQLGTLVFNLKPKLLNGAEPFPQLLIEGTDNGSNDFKGYSYAIYSDGKLLDQSGKYIYKLTNTDFKGKLHQPFYKFTTGDSPVEGGYSHLIYQPSARKLIVISKADDLVFSGINSITFFFLVFVVFTLLLLGTTNLWNTISRVKNLKSIKNLKWSFWDNFDKVLYKTRIQLSMIFAVVITLLIIGVLTFLSVQNQIHNQEDDTIRGRISRIATAYEKEYRNKKFIGHEEEKQLLFNSFAGTFSADLTLFGTDGKKLFTTQPKLYEARLIAPLMNAKAFINLNKLQKSGFINDEIIGNLDYKAAYAPVRDIKKNVVGFLQLPYFANQADYGERIGAFLNTMINVYAFVFIVIGLFAIVVARQITTPLTIIQQSLSKTIYGRKNEPIKWQHNDEIGSLIKEYNKMIAALENSAQKLARSERENAWREMAKQVAHEIKNPLTPLKLGLQLLEKSWKDKDPRFDAKFERFSKSFVEQIDSLSKIATEFSTFAKMPDTRLELFDVFEVINQAATIFKQTDNFEINFPAPAVQFYILADRDQILRCFNNLLKNAIEAIPAGRRGIVEITHFIKEHEVWIKIKDNGNGIPPALRERIFVPNFTTKSSGSGLGLALVKNTLENAGGNISFETEMNAGTTFTISLPEAT